MRPWQGKHGKRRLAVPEKCTEYRILGKMALMALLALRWSARSVMRSVIRSVIPSSLPELPGKSKSKMASKMMQCHPLQSRRIAQAAIGAQAAQESWSQAPRTAPRELAA